jgi:probable HAF family extracellular repeat protein
LIPNVPGAVYSSAPFGVSDDGNVVAGVTTFASNNPQQAWVWTRTGGTVLLGQNPYASGALGISGDGSTIVGSEGDSPITARAVRWDRSGVVTPLSESAIYTSTTASAASHNGSVVVGEVVEGDSSVAMRWANGSSVVVADNAQAMAISADGSVVVGRFVPDVIQAFRWTAATGAVGLGFLPGGNSSDALGISTDGSVVVGGANTAASGPFYEAFRWTAAGGMQSIGHIGNGSTFATGTTADGSVIVGEANGQQTAFIWDATHGMRTLADALEQDYGFDSSEFELEGALGISPDGRYIIGYGSGDNFTGAWVINLPEPGSSAVLCGALGCLVLRRGRAARSKNG